MESRFHCSNRYTQQAGDFPIRQLLHVAQDNHLPEFLGERVDGGPHLVVDDVGEEAAFGVGPRDRPVDGHGVGGLEVDRRGLPGLALRYSLMNVFRNIVNSQARALVPWR